MMQSRPTIDGTFNFSADAVSDIELMTIKHALKYKSVGGDKFGFGESQEINLCTIDDSGRVSVPRRYAYENLSSDLLESALDLRESGSDIQVTFDEEQQAQRPDLKIRQDKLIESFLDNLQSPKNPHCSGMAAARCGCGKTVVASKMIAKLGKTALVLVHKEFLMKQWIERLLQFTDLRREDIGIVQKDKCEFEGKKVVIAMIQSLLRETRYTEDFYSWTGVIFVDECHRIGAPQFNKSIPQFSAKLRIGLTATPRRGDGLQGVFEQQLGPVIAQMSGGNEILPKIYQIPYDIHVPESLYIWRQDGKIKKKFLGKLVSLLALVEKRNEWIVKEISRAASAGRKVLVFSDRRDQLKIINELLASTAPTYTTGFYVGGMSEKALEKAETCDIILSTFQMAKEGLDIPAVDTLFLVTPKSDVEQSVGRILRYHSDKKEPIVVDIVDTVQMCLDFAKSRLRIYTKLGYDVVKKV